MEEEARELEKQLKLNEEFAKIRAEKERRKQVKLDEKLKQKQADKLAFETIVLKDIWTQNQQILFENALLKYTTMMERHERWIAISNEVTNKTPNQCLLRYKYLKEYVLMNKQN